MFQRPASPLWAVLVFCVLCGAAAASAAGPGAGRTAPVVVIVDGDGGTVTLTAADDRLQIVSLQDGELEVETIDLEELGEMIGRAVESALRGVDQAVEAVALHVCAPEPRLGRTVSSRQHSEGELRAEIAALKAELAELRRDLQRRR